MRNVSAMSKAVTASRTTPVRKQPGTASASYERGPAQGTAPRPGNHVIVMFGATGDLARRKLLPGLFHLAAAGLMPNRYEIIGSSRRTMTDSQFREHTREAIAEFGIRKPTGAAWQAFKARLSFVSADPDHARS